MAALLGKEYTKGTLSRYETSLKHTRNFLRCKYNDQLTQVRNIFLFCCFTGLAYADVKKLRRWEIVTGVDGEKWLSINRLKSDVPSRTPLLPTAMVQKMNSYLKEIAGVNCVSWYRSF